MADKDSWWKDDTRNSNDDTRDSNDDKGFGTRSTQSNAKDFDSRIVLEHILYKPIRSDTKNIKRSSKDL